MSKSRRLRHLLHQRPNLEPYEGGPTFNVEAYDIDPTFKVTAWDFDLVVWDD